MTEMIQTLRGPDTLQRANDLAAPPPPTLFHCNHDLEARLLSIPAMAPERWPEIEQHGGLLQSPRNQHIHRAMREVYNATESMDLGDIGKRLDAAGVLNSGKADQVTPENLAELTYKRNSKVPSQPIVEALTECRRNARLKADMVKIDARIGDSDDGDVEVLLRDAVERYEQQRPGLPAELEVLDMSGLSDPACGEMKYLLPGSTPAVTLITTGAEWKVGKTFGMYRKALDAATGNRVFGFYPSTDAIRVGILQLEMPATEDMRRMRRLALGGGIEERHLPDLFNDGQIVMFNRPKVKIGGKEEPFNLTKPASRDMLHEASERHKIKYWIVDSVIRAFAGANLNDNSEVAGLLCLAYDPLTSAGCSVEQCHHKRKTGPDGKDDAKSSLLAAQAFGAGSGLIMGLNSLPDRDDFLPSHGLHKFVNRLSVLGAWGPIDCSELAIGFYDEGPRTLCHATADMAQVAKSSKTRRCAWLASEIVRDKPGLNTNDLAAKIVVRFPDEFHGEKTSGRTAKDGITEAQAQDWIENRGKGRGQASDYHALPGAQMASP